jgi:hypothetical protein
MRLVRRTVQLSPLILAAIFAIAQVQGTVHGIAHLNPAAGVSDRATVPHSILCVECAAFAQAGAAPISAPPAVPARTLAGGVVDRRTASFVAAGTAAAYRSRAPPPSPI